MPTPAIPAATEAALAGPQRSDNALRGIGLMLLSTVFLSTSDATSKFLAGHIPPVQITWLRYSAFVVIMLAIVLRGGGSRLRTGRLGMQVLRAVGLVGSSIVFVVSLKYLPIADAIATGFVSPLFVTALSIPILGEIVGWRRWTATLVGLAGVIIVVRPGGTGFSLASLLPVLSALFWAFSLIVTRMMSTTENPVTTLTYSALIGFVIVSLLLPFFWQPLDASTIALGIFVGIASTIGHWLVVLSFRHADASLLAPFSYIHLLWAAIFGYALFSVLPDFWTVIGSLIIAASGLYTAHRERIRARALSGRASAPA